MVKKMKTREEIEKSIVEKGINIVWLEVLLDIRELLISQSEAQRIRDVLDREDI